MPKVGYYFSKCSKFISFVALLLSSESATHEGFILGDREYPPLDVEYKMVSDEYLVAEIFGKQFHSFLTKLKIFSFSKIPETFSQNPNIRQRRYFTQNECENILYHLMYRPLL